jgi:hypothetical protein
VRRAPTVRKIEPLGDEDILEVIDLPPGSEVRVRKSRPAPPPIKTLPRLVSITDGVDTDVSDIVAELAALSNPNVRPRIKIPLPIPEALTPQQELILILVETNMTLGAIANVSPFGDEKTTNVLGNLIALGWITLL